MSYSTIIILTCIICTAIFRFMPYVLFPENKPTPQILVYLSDKLPLAIVGLLIVYSLKDVEVARSYMLPEIISILLVIILHKTFKNSLVSIIGSTLVYMALVQFIFV